jgi:hypothetical protein
MPLRTGQTLHADTQGQSEPVFGLSRLLGIKLMPRMRGLSDVAIVPSAVTRLLRQQQGAAISTGWVVMSDIETRPLFTMQIKGETQRLGQTHGVERQVIILTECIIGGDRIKGRVLPGDQTG